MKKFILLTAILISFESLATDPKEAVLETVQNVFEAMRTNDSVLLVQQFTSDARLNTVSRKEGKMELRTGSLERFAEVVGKPRDKILDEPIWDCEIKIDGGLAQVWAKYALFIGDEFSHCGVDAFHLYNSEDGWKIFQLTDTRQFEGCEIPEEIKVGRLKK